MEEEKTCLLRTQTTKGYPISHISISWDVVCCLFCPAQLPPEPLPHTVHCWDREKARASIPWICYLVLDLVSLAQTLFPCDLSWGTLTEGLLAMLTLSTDLGVLLLSSFLAGIINLGASVN